MAVALAAAISSVAPAAEAAPRAAVVVETDPGSLGIRLLDVPVDAVDDPRARTYIVDQLTPGTTVQRRVELSNTTGVVLNASVYSAAASITDGAFVGAEGRTANELSGWTTLSAETVDIPAGGVARVTATVTVPQDAAPGEQYAVIWTETSGGGDGAITQVNRVGVRMYVAVGGDNPLASAFTVDSMTASRDADGRPVVRGQVHNTGGRALDISGTLTMAAVSGSLNAGPYDAVLGTTLAPGESEPVAFTLADDIEDGPWDATIVLHSGLLTGTFDARITFPHDAGAAPAVAAHAEPTSDHRLVLVLIVLAVVLLAAVIYLGATRRRREPTPVLLAESAGSDAAPVLRLRERPRGRAGRS